MPTKKTCQTDQMIEMVFGNKAICIHFCFGLKEMILFTEEKNTSGSGDADEGDQ